MGLEDTASAARLKVSAALLPSFRDAPRTAAQRFHLDAPAWFSEPPTPESLSAVAEAVWDDRPILARYRRGPGDTGVERTLEPYGLVLKAGVWYLCARVPEHAGPGTGPFRVYRVDRFTSVEVSGHRGPVSGQGPDERFTRDAGFDLPAFWEEGRNSSRGRSCARRSSYDYRRRGSADCRTPSIPCPPATRCRPVATPTSRTGSP